MDLFIQVIEKTVSAGQAALFLVVLVVCRFVHVSAVLTTDARERLQKRR